LFLNTRGLTSFRMRAWTHASRQVYLSAKSSTALSRAPDSQAMAERARATVSVTRFIGPMYSKEAHAAPLLQLRGSHSHTRLVSFFPTMFRCGHVRRLERVIGRSW